MPEKRFKVIEVPRTVITHRLTEDEISHLGSHGSIYNLLTNCGFTFLGSFLGLLGSLTTTGLTMTLIVLLIVTLLVAGIFFLLARNVSDKNTKFNKILQPSSDSEETFE